jgi:hypothetical protein
MTVRDSTYRFCNDGTWVASLDGYDRAVEAIAFSGKGRWFALGSTDKSKTFGTLKTDECEKPK